MLSIQTNSISQIDPANHSSITPLPKGLGWLRGTQLPSRDLLISDGCTGVLSSNEYLLYERKAKKWKKVGTMKNARDAHSSVFLNGCLFTCGGVITSGFLISPSSFHEGFTEKFPRKKKELPIPLAYHTATNLNENQFLVVGGWDQNVSLFHKIIIVMNKQLKNCIFRLTDQRS